MASNYLGNALPLAISLSLNLFSGFLESSLYSEGNSLAVAGWPVYFVSDNASLSPVGSANIFGTLIGLDHFHFTRFMANLAIWSMASFSMRALFKS